MNRYPFPELAIETDELAIGALVRRWIWMLLAFGMVGAAAAALMVSGRESVFEADARVLVGPINAGPDDIDAAGSLTRTYSELVESRSFVDAAAAAVGLPANDIDVRAIPNPETRVLLITVRANDRLGAPRVANRLVELLGKRVEEVEGAPLAGVVQVIDEAQSPAPKADAATTLVIATGIAAGGIAGVAAAVALERTRRRGRQLASQPDEGLFLGQVTLSLADVYLRSWPHRVTNNPGGKRVVEHRLAIARLRLANAGAPQCFVLAPVESSPNLAVAALDLATVAAHDGAHVVLIDAEDGTITAATDDAYRYARKRLTTFESGGSLRILQVIGTGQFDPKPIEVILNRLVDGETLVLIYCRPARTSPEGLAWLSVAKRAVVLAPTSPFHDDLDDTLSELRLAGAEVKGLIAVRSRRAPFGVPRRRINGEAVDVWTTEDLAGLNGATVPDAGPIRRFDLEPGAGPRRKRSKGRRG